MEHALFNLAEALFALLPEDIRNTLMVAILDIPIQVIEGTPQLLGQRLAHRGFTGAHVSNENDALHITSS